ncbi:hypothetical protein [Inhella proteolytica]|uniref:Uncharacterized protein n=1 Tax=Inhella proteolytica TaxID=2795029 RepID=A0A931J475_9BURK|nr:hypothetical protein [Inhella proteolytica]MBH9577468.1 hypothetical protein [Inhella proteolytica]
MKSAFRALLGLLAGMMVAVAVIATIEAVGHKIWPLPPSSGNSKDPAVVAALLAAAPLGALVSVVLAWWAGAAGGAWIGYRFAGEPHARAVGLGVAGVIWLATAANLLLISHPAWMMAGGLLGVPLAGWLAVQGAQARQKRQS